MKRMTGHIFYPIVNQTVRSLISVAEEQIDRNFILYLLNTYPNQDENRIESWIADGCNKTILFALLNELDRQYARWNKGGQK